MTRDPGVIMVALLALIAFNTCKIAGYCGGPIDRPGERSSAPKRP